MIFTDQDVVVVMLIGLGVVVGVSPVTLPVHRSRLATVLGRVPSSLLPAAAAAVLTLSGCVCVWS